MVAFLEECEKSPKISRKSSLVIMIWPEWTLGNSMGNLSWDELSSSQISQLGFGGLYSKLSLGKSSDVFFSTWGGPPRGETLEDLGGLIRWIRSWHPEGLKIQGVT